MGEVLSEKYILLLNGDADLGEMFEKYSETSIASVIGGLKRHMVPDYMKEFIRHHPTQGTSDNNFLMISGPESLAQLLNILYEAYEYGVPFNNIYSSGDYIIIDIA